MRRIDRIAEACGGVLGSGVDRAFPPLAKAQTCFVAISAPLMGVRLNSGTNKIAMTSA